MVSIPASSVSSSPGEGLLESSLSLAVDDVFVLFAILLGLREPCKPVSIMEGAPHGRLAFPCPQVREGQQSSAGQGLNLLWLPLLPDLLEGVLQRALQAWL